MVTRFSAVHLFVLLGAAAAFGLFIWALISVAKNNSLTQNTRLFWILLVVFFPFLGSIAWLTVAAKKAKSK
jgi:Phospholipase_D-nuclease N-terminal